MKIEEVRSHCWHCGSFNTMIWQSDWSYEDYGMEGEGIISLLTCSNCGAEVQYSLGIDEEAVDDKNIVKVNSKQQIIKVNLKDLLIKSVLSYSRLETYEKCPYKYKLKYIDKNYSSDSAIALDVGTLCHYIMEMKYKDINNDELLDIFVNGKEDENIMGIKQLDEYYGFDLYEINAKTNTSYNDKLTAFKSKFLDEKMDEDWEVLGTEVEFNFVFNDKAVIHGFIDRIDQHKETGDIRVIDYKTNGKVFDKKFLATPLQMYIYSLACYELYGKYPVECIYDMLFLDLKQIGGTKGYMDRGFKKLDGLIESLAWFDELGYEYMSPKQSPLCYWCEFCENNPNANEHKDKCEYYSLWTPDNKSFKVNKEWVAPVNDDNDGWE